MKKKKKPFTVYFSSELYAAKHLLGNAYLAEAIYERSHGRYLCLLPQDNEPPTVRPHQVRDHDLRMLAGCDLALFTFDGADLDSGTLVEFMFAKFADIPAVILRTDTRVGGDGTNPWSLMASYYPRTVSVVQDGLSAYQSHRRRRGRARKIEEHIRLAAQHSSADSQWLCDVLAASCVRALERARELPPVMPRYVRDQVYHWLALMPGLRGKEKDLRKEFERMLERKIERGLL